MADWFSDSGQVVGGGGTLPGNPHQIGYDGSNLLFLWYEAPLG